MPRQYKGFGVFDARLRAPFPGKGTNNLGGTGVGSLFYLTLKLHKSGDLSFAGLGDINVIVGQKWLNHEARFHRGKREDYIEKDGCR